MPGSRTWGWCAIVYVVFLVCAFPVGTASGLLRPGPPALTAPQMIAAGLLILLHPAFVEECVFRGLLLPRDTGSTGRLRLAAMAAVSLVLYVASHPLNAWVFRPQAARVFDSPAYLALTTLLGLACMTAYWISRSLWPSVLMHWTTVVVWLWFLGGQRLLEFPR